MKSRFTYYDSGDATSILINFENMRGLLFVLFTRTEILIVKKWSTNATSVKVVSSVAGAVDISQDGFLLKLTSEARIYAGMIAFV